MKNRKRLNKTQHITNQIIKTVVFWKMTAINYIEWFKKLSLATNDRHKRHTN